MREYPGLKLDKQAQFFNFMVKAGRKMTDSDLKMVIESFKRRVGERNGEQGYHLITQVAIFAKTFVNFMSL